MTPLSPSELNIGFADDTFSLELEALYKDYVVQNDSNVSKCIECNLPTRDLVSHFQSGSNYQECSVCKLWLPSKCSLRYVYENLRGFSGP